ncbi:hypothetical protein GCM10025734_77560 [Kitasatospora paranensis]
MNPHTPATSGTPGRLPGRRDLLRWSGALVAAAAVSAARPAGAAAATPGAAAAAASTFGPLRPPAVPLAVRSPYLSTWLPGDSLVGTWPAFWNGHITALCGIARIDGAAYVFAGAPSVPGGPALTPMQQTDLTLTATRSIYTLTGGGVTLTVTFFSPSTSATSSARACRSATSRCRPPPPTAAATPWTCTSTSPASGCTATSPPRSPGTSSRPAG